MQTGVLFFGYYQPPFVVKFKSHGLNFKSAVKAS